MATISKAEQARRKESKIFAQYDRYLELLEQAYRKKNPDHVQLYYAHLQSFKTGCHLVGGYHWSDKLLTRFNKWYDSHKELIDFYKANMEAKKGANRHADG